jgi:hypothetical protein
VRDVLGRDEAMTKTCEVCGTEIKMMCRRGEPTCSLDCDRVAGRGKYADREEEETHG